MFKRHILQIPKPYPSPKKETRQTRGWGERFRNWFAMTICLVPSLGKGGEGWGGKRS